jgi:serine/threonine protein kinase
MPADVIRVKELFLAVLEMPDPERTAYLDSHCAGDPALRQQIEAMLRSNQDSGELLSQTPEAMLADSAATEAEAGSAPDDLSFLAPSATPQHLGRLAHYEVKEVIGRGGFGVVLKAFDQRLHRVVAIKVLAPAFAASAAARKRFIREARAAAAVKNEHVVAIHDVQEDARPPYIVMECIDGIGLQDKIDRAGTLGVKEVLRIGMQIAEGLAAAHRQGLVHRDIKPANILLENGVERVKITDFGLARAVDDASVTQSGTVAGTPMYMSPEQAEGFAVDHRSDLFSLGSVLYAMCTGHPPFRASGTHAVLKRVIDASPRPICEINNDTPQWLCAVINRLHAKKPEERFQTANELAELLGQRLADVQAGRAIQLELRSGTPQPAVAGAESAPTVPSSPPRRSWRDWLYTAVGCLAVVWIPLRLLRFLPALDRHLQPWVRSLYLDEPTLAFADAGLRRRGSVGLAGAVGVWTAAQAPGRIHDGPRRIGRGLDTHWPERLAAQRGVLGRGQRSEYSRHHQQRRRTPHAHASRPERDHLAAGKLPRRCALRRRPPA